MDTEICWHGRGGQGVVTANEILAESAIYSGKYVKAFPEFGPERMGAPIRAFARISDGPVRVHTQVYEPDIVIVIDPTLIGKVDVVRGLKKGGFVLANYEGTPAELQKAIGTTVECHAVKASKIAVEEIGKNMVNTAMLGALVKIRPIISFSEMEDHITDKFTEKLSDKMIVKNLAALKRAYEEVQRDGQSSRLQGHGHREQGRRAWQLREIPHRGLEVHGAGRRQVDLHRLPLLLGLLSGQLHHSRERAARRLQDHPLQGVRDLRQGLPQEGHHHEGGHRMTSKVGNDIAVNGDGAVALAWRQINPDVVAAYPITPQTIIVEDFARYVANAEVTTEFIDVESEHSALTLCTTSCAAGARTFTATASQGLAYMWEMLPITAAMRTPLMMAVANRTVSGPININNDHGDVMSARDTGWLSLFSENVQEAYDMSIVAPRIAEDPGVQLPVLVNLDGFILTHAIERMTPLESSAVREFVGPFTPLHPLLDTDHPVTHNLMDGPMFYFPHKYQMVKAMENALGVAEDVFAEFRGISGREYHLVEEYMCDDAEYVAIVLGSSFGTMKQAVDNLREEGMKVGVAMPRVYRPWPARGIAELCRGKKAVIVMDRHLSTGAYGPMFPEVCAAACGAEMPSMYDFIYGLGGADTMVSDFMSVYKMVEAGAAKTVNFVGVNE